MKRRRAFSNESRGLEQLETLPELVYTPEELERLDRLRIAWSKLRPVDDKEEIDDEVE